MQLIHQKALCIYIYIQNNLHQSYNVQYTTSNMYLEYYIQNIDHISLNQQITCNVCVYH